MAENNTIMATAADEEYRHSAFWGNLSNGAPREWRDVLDNLGALVAERLDVEGEVKKETMKRVDALMDRLRPLDDALADELDKLVGELICDGERVGVRIGYALARTMPSRLDDLHTWPERAARFSGLARASGRDEPGPEGEPA